MPGKDGFFQNVNKFFKRVQNQDLIKLSGDHVTSFNAPASEEENKRRSEFSVFRQYLQAKNWSTKHVELFDEYRKMDATYPIINAALKLYGQECITGDSIVNTPRGPKTIKQLIEEERRVKDMFYVESYNKQWEKVEWNMAFGIKANGKKPVYKVTVHRNIPESNIAWDKQLQASFKCTADHEVMIDKKGNFKKLKDLKSGDSIFGYYKEIDPSCSCKKDGFTSTTILSIEHTGEEEVYDLINVSPNHHFSLQLTDSFYVQVHNCCTKDSDGNVMKIITDDKDVKKALQECFFDNLKINSQSYLFVKEFLKFGNLFCFINTRRGVGVTDLINLPPEAMRIQLIQNAENLDSFKFHWYGNGGGLQFEPWEVAHFKNIEDIEMQPYGVSILRPVVDTWRRIILIREALIIYRITRAPQRFLYKIDTTGMDPDAALKFAEEMKKSLDKKTLINPQTGEIDWKYNPISIAENVYMPSFEGDVGGVSILEGANNMDQLEDYAVIKDDLFAGLLIPKSYLCLHPDTKIKSLDGNDYSILELFEKHKKGEEIGVYACDKNGDIVPGNVSWVGETRKTKQTYIIELDNGEKVECSEDHEWLLRNGTYIKTKDLKVEDSLMPLYTQLSNCSNGKKKYKGYEKVFHNGKEKWQLTHQMVVLHNNPKFYHQDGNGIILCHHRDHNKRNNLLSNLERMNQSEHWKYHNQISDYFQSDEAKEKKKKTRATKEFKEKMSLRIKKMYEEHPEYLINTSKRAKTQGLAKIMQVKYEEHIKNKTITQLGENNINYKGNISAFDLNNLLNNLKIKTIKEIKNQLRINFPSVVIGGITFARLAAILGLNREEFLKKYKFPNSVPSRKIKEINEEKIIELIYQRLNFRKIAKQLKISCEMINNHFIYKYKKNFFEFQRDCLNNIYFTPNETKAPYNHKIKSIEIKYYDKEIQLYDLTVDNYHNFALSAGVFVSNSFEEDLSNKAALCLSANTNIFTNEGLKTIKELADGFNKEEKLYVLSCNKHGIITSGRILNCWATKKVKELYKITISNNKTIECTDNHPFMRDNLTYTRADELKIGDGLKGIYEKEYFVKNIELFQLQEEEWVYDLEVEEYHNFAVEAGIFVHNSQEDLRFSNAIKQYQSYFIEGLLHIALVHLHINGFSEDDLDSFSIEMNTNSTLAEKTRNELLQQRLDLANSALNDQYGMSLMSFTQVMKEILKFTDEEIAKTFKDQMIEKKIIWRLGQLKEQGFYDEPEPEKKKAMMKGLNTDEDVFSDLKLEASETLPIVKSILMEKLNEEIKFLTKNTKVKPTKKQIDMAIVTGKSKLEANRKNVMRDMGLKD